MSGNETVSEPDFRQLIKGISEKGKNLVDECQKALRIIEETNAHCETLNPEKEAP